MLNHLGKVYTKLPLDIFVLKVEEDTCIHLVYIGTFCIFGVVESGTFCIFGVV